MLKNWALVTEYDPFKAPEARQMYLRGQLQETDEFIMIPVEVGDFNPETHTLGGHVLDNPHPAYLKWLRDNPPERFGKTDPDPLRTYAMGFISKN